MKKKPKLIVILGPTATGKSDFAVNLAREMAKKQGKKIVAEIVSADSRQVYKGLDIGSGKITKKEMRSVPHHLLDVANPKYVFSVSEYQRLATKAIAEILERKNTPILVGGTGFYIDAVVYGTVFPEVPPNKELRKKLENKNAESLFKILQKLDSTRAKNIDPKNKVRVIRAIEIAKALGKVPKLQTKLKYDAKVIGLTLPQDILQKRIKTRLEKRIKMGMIQEVKNLHDKQKISWKRLEQIGFDQKYVAQYLQKKNQNPPSQSLRRARQEMFEKLLKENIDYSKRQMTWFKRNKDITWKKP